MTVETLTLTEQTSKLGPQMRRRFQVPSMRTSHPGSGYVDSEVHASGPRAPNFVQLSQFACIVSWIFPAGWNSKVQSRAHLAYFAESWYIKTRRCTHLIYSVRNAKCEKRPTLYIPCSSSSTYSLAAPSAFRQNLFTPTPPFGELNRIKNYGIYF